MNIHFVGIGGIGVSALARHYLLSGEKVTGSDLATSEIINDLKNLGANIYNQHDEDNLNENVDLVIYSPAVPNDNPELKKAKELSIEAKSYPEALGDLTKNYFTIAVSGTHGKSTTTAMAALMLEEAGLDPTVIVGTKLEEFDNSNYRKGDSKYLLIEADEWQGSLLNYKPNIAILTNLELEHLDYYKDLDHLLETFQEYLDKMEKEGEVIMNKKDNNLSKLKVRQKKHLFSKNEKVADEIKNRLKVPGLHNLENALAVNKLGEILGINKEVVLFGLSKYKGSWRRFEKKKIKINGKDYQLVLDYAHHPTELKATLQALKEEFPNKKTLAVFQPHQYQRSMHLKDKFIDVFKNSPVDQLFITDIYSVPGREKQWIKEQITSKMLVNKTNLGEVAHLAGDLEGVANKLKSNLQGNEIIAIIGAGDIYKLENSLKG
ncbi:MAG: UDP-N-acetylmuramate--L-alanine ligase [Patescibacteria group bacterium]